jgi:polysaccharide export outer membrane protein
MSVHFVRIACGAVLCTVAAFPGFAGQGTPAQSPAQASVATPADALALPAGYVIGPEDVLTIVFWREKDMSGDVQVRPDGKISVALINDIQAAGLTPDQLRNSLAKAATKFIEDPEVTVVVKDIRSRKVFITGQVAKPSHFMLVGEMTVLQLIAQAGGLLEYADKSNIVVARTEDGRPKRIKFNYKDVLNGKSPDLALKPGDTVIVP